MKKTLQLLNKSAKSSKLLSVTQNRSAFYAPQEEAATKFPTLFSTKIPQLFSSQPELLKVSFDKPAIPVFKRDDVFSSHSDAFNCESLLKKIAALHNDIGRDKPFENIMVVAVQHILATTVDMFKVMHNLGLSRVIIGGKSYSTHQASANILVNELGYTFIEAPEQIGYGHYDICMQETVTNIWNAALKEMQRKPVELLIILDDGGDLIKSTPAKLFNGISYKPKHVVGIEQTRGGSNNRYFKASPFPIINVAGAYVKTAIGYPRVAEIVAKKVESEIQKATKNNADFPAKPIIGVIGNGTMGKAVTERFINSGYRVLVHDKDNKTQNKKAIWRADVPSLVSSADVIIGCTGTDITAEANTLDAILNSIRPKILVSTSSKDQEFNTLLVLIQEKTKKLLYTPNPLQDIKYVTLHDSEITIIKGGFPVNFNNEEHSVSPDGIWPTRAALLCACLQGTRAYYEKMLNTTNILMLDVSAQKNILKMYQQINPDDPSIQKIAGLSDNAIEKLILEGSDGVALESSIAKDEVKSSLLAFKQ